MTEQIVYKVRPIMFLRFIIGIGQIRTKAARIRLFSKLYTLFIGLSLVYLDLNYAHAIPLIVRCSACLEYFSYVIISIQTEDMYIYKYNNYLPGIDNLIGASNMYKRLNIILFISVTSLVISAEVLVPVVYCCFNLTLCEKEIVGIFAMNIMWLACDICKLTLVYIFALLYCRVKLMRMSLEVEFNCSNRCSVDIYVKKYLLIFNCVKEINYPVQLLVSMQVFNDLIV